MSGDHIKSFLEVLTNTFIACDENESGVVEINKLVDFLISQVPYWQNDESVREEICKILHSVSDNLIKKEDFIKSLLEQFKTSFCQENDENLEDACNTEAGTCSSTTSGIEDITSGSSTNSMEEIASGVNFVSDGQIFTNENMVDETSLNDSGSSQADSSFIDSLQNEIFILLRKNEYLENFKNSLVGQVSVLEDSLAKKNEEVEDYMKQITTTNKLLDIQTQKQEEIEDKLNLLKTTNNSVIIELSHSENENLKLKTMISQFEQKLECVLNENMKESAKVQDITEKFNKLNGLYHNSKEALEEELGHLKLKVKEREEACLALLEENKNLQSQLDSSTSYAQDLKSKLTSTEKELTGIKNSRKKEVMLIKNSANLVSADNSMASLDENFSPNSTIPFEESLLAELQDEVDSDKQECCNMCKQNLSSITCPFDSVGNAAIKIAKETVNKATMTTCFSTEEPVVRPNVEQKDVAVECSIKVMSADNKSSRICFLKSQRSFEKWVSLLAVLLFLCFLLVVFSVYVFVLYSIEHSVERVHKPLFCFTSFFNLLNVKTSNILKLY